MLHKTITIFRRRLLLKIVIAIIFTSGIIFLYPGLIGENQLANERHNNLNQDSARALENLRIISNLTKSLIIMHHKYSIPYSLLEPKKSEYGQFLGRIEEIEKKLDAKLFTVTIHNNFHMIESIIGNNDTVQYFTLELCFYTRDIKESQAIIQRLENVMANDIAVINLEITQMDAITPKLLYSSEITGSPNLVETKVIILCKVT